LNSLPNDEQRISTFAASTQLWALQLRKPPMAILEVFYSMDFQGI
jgi:hypothetical protein